MIVNGGGCQCQQKVEVDIGGRRGGIKRVVIGRYFTDEFYILSYV